MESPHGDVACDATRVPQTTRKCVLVSSLFRLPAKQQILIYVSRKEDSRCVAYRTENGYIDSMHTDIPYGVHVYTACNPTARARVRARTGIISRRQANMRKLQCQVSILGAIACERRARLNTRDRQGEREGEAGRTFNNFQARQIFARAPFLRCGSSHRRNSRAISSISASVHSRRNRREERERGHSRLRWVDGWVGGGGGERGGHCRGILSIPPGAGEGDGRGGILKERLIIPPQGETGAGGAGEWKLIFLRARHLRLNVAAGVAERHSRRDHSRLAGTRKFRIC